ncbi:MFS transporter [Dankookia sp. GCM10030260]|uniref:MFS transporter n=1 Tax=Dankookia sp. GCM10030260 TaxID=3273390 RepID=UPI00360D3A60
MTPRNRWLELLLIGVARIAMGVQFQAVGALGPLLVGNLVPDWTALGTLIGAYSLAGVAVALPAGWLLARFGDRRILLAGVALMTLGGVVVALAPGFGMALLGRLVAGGGSALLTIACAKRVLDRFAGPALAPAMGVMLSAWPVGIAAALLLLPLAGEDFRLGLAGSAALCGLALPLLAWAVPKGADPEGQRGPVARMARLLPGEWGGLLAVGALWAFYNAAFAVLLGFAPAFLVAQGASPAEAGAVASLVGWAILPLLPLGGALVERLGRPLLACAGCILGMAAALLGLVAGWPAVPMLVACGLLSAPPASLIMACLGRVLSPGSRPFGVGIHYMMFYAGMAVLPALAGLLRDVTGAPATPILAAVGFLGASLVALAALGVSLAAAAAAQAPLPR